jgi:hypothetical protein
MKNERTLTVYSGFGSMSDEPRIQLMGKWVRELGFRIGDLIRLKVEKNRIIIKNMEIKEMVD